MKIIEKNHRFNGGFKLRKATKRVVIHHSASGDISSETIHRWHLDRRWIGIGYHYVIRQNGDIETGRPEDTVGAHAGAGANPDSIGICLVGNFEHDKPTAAQMKSLAWLIKNVIYAKYGVLPIQGHKDHMATACPGRYFPWSDLKEFLTEPTPLPVRLTINKNQSNATLRIVDGRTEALLSGSWVQLRDLANLLLAGIEWDEKTRTINFVIKE